MQTHGYLLQKLRSSCEALVSNQDMRSRLYKAANHISQLIGVSDYGKHNDKLSSITDQLATVDAMTDEEMESLSQSILELFESVASDR